MALTPVPVRTGETTTRTSQGGVLSRNRVLRNTYALLAMTLLFSAATAGLAMSLGMPHPGMLVTLGGYIGLLFLTSALRNSVWGIAAVFALTGFMGLTLGPVLNAYLTFLPNGHQLIMLALGGTGTAFVALSALALDERRDFSFMASFITVGIVVALVAAIGALVFSIPGLALAVSAMMVVLMSGAILVQTSEIVHGGETNYIMATVSLYVSIYNLFTSLLHLLGVFSSDE